MRCNICHQPLTSDTYATWKVGNRQCYVWFCANIMCLPDTIPRGITPWMEVISPEQEIANYSVGFLMNDKWYKLNSLAPSQFYLNGMSTFSAYKYMNFCFYESVVFTISRHYPLDWHIPLAEQLPRIQEKLQTLTPFI